MGGAIAVITARGGSKRIPGKNIRDFAGQPIIKYSIDAALESGCFDEVMVSTDDGKIAETAKKYGAVVPFFRSAATSGDLATSADVMEEVLVEYANRKRFYEYACCIYPTAPLASSRRIKAGFEMLMSGGADSVIPVVRFGYPIQRGLKIENGRLSMIWPENMNARSQDLMSAYHDAAQFYWLRVGSFMKQKKFFMADTLAIEVPESEVQDIDNEEDWKIAEIKYRILKNNLR